MIIIISATVAVILSIWMYLEMKYAPLMNDEFDELLEDKKNTY